MKRYKTNIFFIIILGLSLQGCFAVVGGAALGAVGASVMYDHRDINTMMNDETISRHITLALNADKTIRTQCHVVVSTYKGTVLLAGQAPTPTLRNKIEKIAREQAQAQSNHLYNEISIEGPTTMLSRSSDAWITTKVKTTLLNTPDLKSGQIKVVTENGTVYLMGIVSRSQAQSATNATRTVEGVQKVVTVFQYQRNIDPEEAAISKANTTAKAHGTYKAKTTKSKYHATRYIGM